MLKFRAKTLSRKELQCRNMEFAFKASSISREAAGIEEDGETGQGETPAILKRGLDEVISEDEGEDEVGAKRARFAKSRLLDFEGPVSRRLISECVVEADSHYF
jgi:hypothetical protein